jgi:hypothetical protein
MRSFPFRPPALAALAALLLAAPMYASAKPAKIAPAVSSVRIDGRNPAAKAAWLAYASGDASFAGSVSRAARGPKRPESGALLLLGGGMCLLAALLRGKRTSES